DEVIELVDTVEDRTTRISRTLGIDQAFFRATDPAGTLREFNTMVDGEPTSTDRANASYVAAIAKPDKETMDVVSQLPPGAFGVWQDAPVDGVFALFEMAATKELGPDDADYFRSTLGMPVLALDTATEEVELQAPLILELLSRTKKGERSGSPTDAAAIRSS